MSGHQWDVGKSDPRASEQLGFLGAATISPATGKPLRPRQQFAFNLVRETPGGITADVLGAHIHALRGRHPESQRCQFCGQEGQSILRSKGLRGLVIHRRKRGVWEARDGSTPPAPPAEVQPSSQIRDGLPDWLGGDAA